MRNLFFKLLRYSGLPYLFRELIQNNKVTILMFHDISEETAEKTFLYLQKKYNIISLNTYINACESQKNDKIPEKALIITFDDGHIRNYEVMSVLKNYNISITIFLCSSIINTNRHYWFNFKTNDGEFSKLEMKRKLNKDRLAILSTFGFDQEKEFDKPQALQKKHINIMKKYVNFQSHTMFHPILPKCDDEVAKEEISKSKEALEKEYNIIVNTIAYPNGDYSERDIILVKEAGYKCGITVDYGYNTINSDLFRLKRLSVNDTVNLDELIVKSSGVWGFINSIRDKYQN